MFYCTVQCMLGKIRTEAKKIRCNTHAQGSPPPHRCAGLPSPHYGRNNINSTQPCLEITDNKDKHKYI